jgi:hypothetical protein
MFGKADCESSETSMPKYDGCADLKEPRSPGEQPDTRSIVRKGRRPGISYAELITEAIESSAEGMLTLKEIYAYISNKHPYFSLKKTGWQNSIRHNLSLNKSFYKVPRTPVNPGKGSFWKINYELHSAKASHKNYKARSKYAHYQQGDKDIGSLSEILGGQQSFLDNIGVTEMPFKRSVTTIFDGNLATLSDCFESTYPREYYDYNEDGATTNHIFSFK